MKKKTIVEKILGFFGVGVEKEQHKPEVKEVIAQPEQKIKRKEITGFEKPKAYINREYSAEEIQRKAKLKELENRKLNFCFIPENQNGINIRSMLEYMYRELPKKTPYGVKTKLRFHMWQRTREIISAKYTKDELEVNLDGTPVIEDGNKKYFEINYCEVCNEYGRIQGNTHDIEIHEEWLFDDKYKTAVLKKMKCLCPKCHKVAHINMSDREQTKDLFIELKYRYCIVNNLLVNGENGLEPDLAKFEEDYEFAKKERELRKGKRYNLDISIWYKIFKNSLEKHNKLKYLDIKNGNARFNTNDEDYQEFLNKEFNGNTETGE